MTAPDPAPVVTTMVAFSPAVIDCTSKEEV